MNEAQRIQALASRLEGIRPIGEQGNDGPPAHQLAYDLIHADESCRAIVEKHVPRLIHADAKDDAAIEDAFHEFREEVRHLLYHLDAPELRDVASQRGAD